MLPKDLEEKEAVCLRSILQVATSFCKAYFLPQGGAAEAATGREGVRDLTRFITIQSTAADHDLIRQS